jgi:proteasome accessory factor B
VSKPKTERLLNLTWALIATRHFLTKEQIRRTVEGYDARSADAFDRMFERDKEELRELGVPVETVTPDPLSANEVGYRIPRDSATLPDLDFSAEEAAVIALAGHVWAHAGHAGQSGQALAKLKAIGVEIDSDAVQSAEPRLAAGEAAFDPMWEAVTTRQPIRFTYQRPGGEAGVRSVEPWGIVNWHGRWYMGGWDLDRQDTRLFRLGRVQGDVEFVGEPGTYDIPEGTDWREVAHGLFPSPAQSGALVRVRRGRCQWLRRAADSVTVVDDEHDDLRITYAFTEALAAEVASYGEDALVIAPPELRDATVRILWAAVQP